MNDHLEVPGCSGDPVIDPAPTLERPAAGSITDLQTAVNDAIAALDRLERSVKARPGDDPRLLGLIRGSKDAVRAVADRTAEPQSGSRLGRSRGQIVTILRRALAKAPAVAFVALKENMQAFRAFLKWPG